MGLAATGQLGSMRIPQCYLSAMIDLGGIAGLRAHNHQVTACYTRCDAWHAHVPLLSDGSDNGGVCAAHFPGAPQVGQVVGAGNPGADGPGCLFWPLPRGRS
jgi:hypothetical protein